MIRVRVGIKTSIFCYGNCLQEFAFKLFCIFNICLTLFETPNWLITTTILHDKSSEVCINTRSPQPRSNSNNCKMAFLFAGQISQDLSMSEIFTFLFTSRDKRGFVFVSGQRSPHIVSVVFTYFL